MHGLGVLNYSMSSNQNPERSTKPLIEITNFKNLIVNNFNTFDSFYGYYYWFMVIFMVKTGPIISSNKYKRRSNGIGIIITGRIL